MTLVLSMPFTCLIIRAWRCTVHEPTYKAEVNQLIVKTKSADCRLPRHAGGQTDSHGLRYAKRSLMSWVGVIPKEGRARGAAPALLLVWHRLFKFFLKKKLNFFLGGGEKLVSYQKKDGRGPARLSFFWYDNDSGHLYAFSAGKKYLSLIETAGWHMAGLI